MQNQYPSWYQSSDGPHISSVVINIAGNIIPVANLILANYGIKLMPDTVNITITTIVFVIFSLRALVAYVHTKRHLLGQISMSQTAAKN